MSDPTTLPASGQCTSIINLHASKPVLKPYVRVRIKMLLTFKSALKLYICTPRDIQKELQILPLARDLESPLVALPLVVLAPRRPSKVQVSSTSIFLFPFFSLVFFFFYSYFKHDIKATNYCQFINFYFSTNPLFLIDLQIIYFLQMA